jgi:hypothetical protein
MHRAPTRTVAFALITLSETMNDPIAATIDTSIVALL